MYFSHIIAPLVVMTTISILRQHANTWLCDWIYKNHTLELKFHLKPNINDALMHYPETSTTWL